MKHNFLFLLVLIMLASCAREEAEPNVETIQFTFNTPPSDGSTGGRSSGNVLPEGASLLLTVTQSNGDVLFSHRRLPLLQLGDSYITEPIQFVHGAYKITDFMLVSDSNEILYATPHKNSPLASAVNTPLAHHFHVSRSAVNNVAMQVISAKNREPKQFGYASFKPEVVHPLMISVLIEQNGEWIHTTARAEVRTESQDSAQIFNLQAKVTAVGLKGPEDGNYTITISKDGYTPQVRTFMYSEIDSGTPMTFLLKKWTATPYLSFFSQSVYDAYDFTIKVAEPANLIIDWGDGTIDTVSNLSGSQSFSHDYGSDGSFASATITGDLHKIIAFTKPSHHLDGADFTYLTGLEELNIDFVYTDIDLRNSPNLKSIYFGGSYYDLLLPAAHDLSDASLSYATNNVNDIVTNIYANTQAKNITNGTLKLEYVPAASAESLAKMDSLRNQYNWNVSYIEQN